MEDIKIREAKIEDLNKIVSLLYQLSPHSKELNFKNLKKVLERNIQDKNHLLYIVEFDKDIIGTGLLLTQMNLSYNGSLSAHIENIVVDKNYRKKGIGKKIVNYLIKRAQEKKCYKVILNCKPENIPFYESCDMKKTGEVEMRLNFD